MGTKSALSHVRDRARRRRVPKNPVTQVRRMMRLAERVGPQVAEPTVASALKVIDGIEMPDAKDAAYDMVVDVLIGFGQFVRALDVAAKMGCAYQRALCYADVRRSCAKDEVTRRRADMAFGLARDQLDRDSRAELDQAIRFLEED